MEALKHGGIAARASVKIRWVDAEEVEEKGARPLLAGVDGILVPGGFGTRGTEGKIAAIQYAKRTEASVPWNMSWHAGCHYRICKTCDRL